MTRALRLWPLLTGTQRYEKVVSTRNRGHGQYIDAPILAYLIETPQGRILYDVGCDYKKIATPELRARYFDPMRPMFNPPQMTEEQRIPRYLQRLGISSKDIDVIFLGHLHFDHAGGLSDMPSCEVPVMAHVSGGAEVNERDLSTAHSAKRSDAVPTCLSLLLLHMKPRNFGDHRCLCRSSSSNSKTSMVRFDIFGRGTLFGAGVPKAGLRIRRAGRRWTGTICATAVLRSSTVTDSPARTARRKSFNFALSSSIRTFFMTIEC